MYNAPRSLNFDLGKWFRHPYCRCCVACIMPLQIKHTCKTYTIYYTRTCRNQHHFFQIKAPIPSAKDKRVVDMPYKHVGFQWARTNEEQRNRDSGRNRSVSSASVAELVWCRPYSVSFLTCITMTGTINANNRAVKYCTSYTATSLKRLHFNGRAYTTTSLLHHRVIRQHTYIHTYMHACMPRPLSSHPSRRIKPESGIGIIEAKGHHCGFHALSGGKKTKESRTKKGKREEGKVIYIYIYICMCVYAYHHYKSYRYTSSLVYIHIHIYVYVYIYTYLYVYTYISTYYAMFYILSMYIMSTLIHRYIYIYVYTHFYAYVCIITILFFCL
jgi:hypothetical protein